MGEFSIDGHESDIVGIDLALDAYRRYLVVKDISGLEQERYRQYEVIADALSSEDRSKLVDKIIDLERPDLAALSEPNLVAEPVSSNHPAIVRLGKMVDDRQVVEAAEEVLRKINPEEEEQ